MNSQMHVDLQKVLSPPSAKIIPFLDQIIRGSSLFLEHSYEIYFEFHPRKLKQYAAYYMEKNERKPCSIFRRDAKYCRH